MSPSSTAKRSVTLICGPPCSGKSTLAQQLAKPGELVLDLDRIARRLGSPQRWHHEPGVVEHAEEIMAGALQQLAVTEETTAYVIRCLPHPARRHRLAAAIRADRVYVVDPGMYVCLARARADNRPRGTLTSIRAWYRDYRRHDRDDPCPKLRPPRAPHPRCGRLKGSCPDHDRAPRDRPHRPTTTQRGYDGRWQRLVAAAKKRQRAELGYAYCVDCGVDEDTAKATDNPLTGDHLRWPAVSIDDVEIVCRRDNSKRGDLRSGVSGP